MSFFSFRKRCAEDTQPVETNSGTKENICVQKYENYEEICLMHTDVVVYVWRCAYVTMYLICYMMYDESMMPYGDALYSERQIYTDYDALALAG